MGLNISGIAINKCSKEDFEFIRKQFGWRLTEGREISFAEIRSSIHSDRYCYLHLCDRGLIILLPGDMCLGAWPLANADTLTFSYNETSMAFYLNYCKDGIEKREIMDVNGFRMMDEGTKLELEQHTEDLSELIAEQMKIVVGQDFWEIEDDQKLLSYSFDNIKPNINENVSQPENENVYEKYLNATFEDINADYIGVYSYDRVMQNCELFSLTITEKDDQNFDGIIYDGDDIINKHVPIPVKGTFAEAKVAFTKIYPDMALKLAEMLNADPSLFKTSEESRTVFYQGKYDGNEFSGEWHKENGLDMFNGNISEPSKLKGSWYMKKLVNGI